MSAKAIRFENVSKRFGASLAVDNVSFTIAAGTLATLLGPSGCGKTTTLRMIAGLEAPSSGHIFIGEEEVTHRSANERDVSMVFQSYALFPHMSVLDNVQYGLKVQGVAKPARLEQAHAALETVGLSGLEKRYPGQLSGGQQQRVAVARALVLQPSVLLFDEPLSNLDAKLRRQMREEIRDLQQRLHLTVVYVTHDQSEAMAVSDRVIVMNKSVIVQSGSPFELYQRPATSFVAGFMGDANHVQGHFLKGTNREDVLALGELTLPLPQPPNLTAAQTVDVAIRPEAIRICGRYDNIENAMQATVVKATYIGAWMEYTLDSPVGRLFAVDSQVERNFAPGDCVHLRFASHGVIALAPAV
jgi:iron(III) transport system ATP-binding protein